MGRGTLTTGLTATMPMLTANLNAPDNGARASRIVLGERPCRVGAAVLAFLPLGAAFLAQLPLPGQDHLRSHVSDLPVSEVGTDVVLGVVPVVVAGLRRQRPSASSPSR